MFLKGKESQSCIRASCLAIVSLLKFDQNCFNEIKAIFAAGANFQLFSLKLRGADAICLLFNFNDGDGLLFLTGTPCVLHKKLFFFTGFQENTGQ